MNLISPQPTYSAKQPLHKTLVPYLNSRSLKLLRPLNSRQPLRSTPTIGAPSEGPPSPVRYQSSQKLQSHHLPVLDCVRKSGEPHESQNDRWRTASEASSMVFECFDGVGAMCDNQLLLSI